ncbi:MAG: zinc ABC transporter substrate-binding protein [Veillonella sp.]|nr:zinc ABC transporter substrate-binding protein [Veillonella sp.]
MRKLLVAVAVVLLAVLIGGCGNNGPQKKDGTLSVVTSFNAMSEFARAVGGERVTVHTIIPDGTEPHDFELKADDIKALSGANVFIYNGLGMEPWAQGAVDAANNSHLTVIEASKNVEKLQNTDLEEIEEHGQFDPHTWLSLRNAITEVTTIKEGLIAADPAGKDFYEANAAAYIAQLQAMDADYTVKFQNVPHKEFVTGHEAFGYLCRDYGLHQESVEDMFAEGEPNAAQLAKLTQFAKDLGIKVIFAEKMASPEVSETLAKEIGAKVETLYTIESDEDGLTYIERMQSNLDKIYNSLL